MAKLAKLTEAESETLEAMLYWVKQGERDKSRIYMLTAQRLKISPETLRSRISRLRAKYEDLMRAAKEIRVYQQKYIRVADSTRLFMEWNLATHIINNELESDDKYFGRTISFG